MTTSAFGVAHGPEDIAKFKLPSLGAVSDAFKPARKAVGALRTGDFGGAAQHGLKALKSLGGQPHVAGMGVPKSLAPAFNKTKSWAKANPNKAIGAAAAGGAVGGATLGGRRKSY